MFEFILKRLSNILLRFLLLTTASNRRLAYIRIYMLLLELDQLTLDETCNISEPSIASSGFFDCRFNNCELSSRLPIEDERSKTSVKSSRKYFVHLNWIRLATNSSWFDSSIRRNPKMRVQIISRSRQQIFRCSLQCQINMNRDM